MIFAHKDGELRIYSGNNYYIKVLFTDANLSAPIARAKTNETLLMTRNEMDSNAHYVQSDDMPIMTPLRITFSCKIEDAGYSASLESLLRGNNTVDGIALTSTQGTTQNVSGYSNPTFSDTTKKCFNIEAKWDGVIDYGHKWSEVYFPREQQTINESTDALTMNIIGDCYGTITKIINFTSGTAIG
jgi:hypothetical protein